MAKLNKTLCPRREVLKAKCLAEISGKQGNYRSIQRGVLLLLETQFEMGSKLEISPYLFNRPLNSNNPKILALTPSQRRL